MNKKHVLLVTGNSIAVIATIIVNTLAVILPLGGKTTNELSDALPNLFVPAGITFSIWSIIYLFLIIFMAYQIYELIKQRDQPYLDKISGWFILASIGNISWIFLWHYQYVTASLAAMLLLLFSLIIIYLRLNIGKTNVPLQEKITVNTTMSIYLGWITVATIANITAVLVNLNVGELLIGQETWALLIIAIATLLTIVVIARRNDIAYSLVIMWAFLGIVLKRLSPDPLFGVQIRIATTAVIAIIIIAVILIIKNIPKTREKQSHIK